MVYRVPEVIPFLFYFRLGFFVPGTREKALPIAFFLTAWIIE
jgi:hypothetical protein